MQQPTVIKLPIHLISLITHEQSCIYIDFFDLESYQYLKETVIGNQEFVKFSKLKNQLNQHYALVEQIDEPGQMTLKGDVITVWLYGYQNPVRLSFFGEECETIHEIDSIALTPIKKLHRLIFVSPSIFHLNEHITIQESTSDKSQIPNSELQIYMFTQRILEKEEKEFVDNYIETDISIPSLYFSKLGILEQDITNLRNQDYKIVLQTKNSKLIPDSLHKYIDNKHIAFNIVDSTIKIDFKGTHQIPIPAGILSESLKIALFTDRELFSSISVINKSFGGHFK